MSATLASSNRIEVAWCDADLEATPTGADVDDVVELARLVDHGRQLLALPERADAAEDVARRALRGGPVGHLDSPRAERPRRRLQRQLPRHRHDGDGKLLVGGDDQRLEHLLGVQPEQFRRLGTVRRARVVLVLQHREGDAGGLEKANCGRHGANFPALSGP